MDKIKIGTRGSKLALWQAEMVADKLQMSGWNTEIVKITTKGDKILDVSISKIGSKGVFTEEIEQQLRGGAIDIAVHSAKDMQSELPKGFEIAAFTEREKVNDVIVSRNAIDLSNPDLRLGTSSVRRIASIRHYYPHLKTVDIRGNLQTRIAKLDAGECNALVLAYAGVKRMGYEALIVHELDTTKFIPAVGQGSLAIEVYKTLAKEKKEAIVTALNDPETALRLRCERAYLRKLQGGCNIPAFALAQVAGDELEIRGGIISLDGSELVKKEAEGKKIDPEKVGEELADTVLSGGGNKILRQIKRQLV